MNWKKQDTAYLGATVVVGALAACVAASGFGLGGHVRPPTLWSVDAGALPPPLVAPAPAHPAPQPVRIELVRVRVPLPVPVPATTSAPTPTITPQPTPLLGKITPSPGPVMFPRKEAARAAKPKKVAKKKD